MLTYQCISIGMTSSIGDVSILVIELKIEILQCVQFLEQVAVQIVHTVVLYCMAAQLY